MVPAVKRLTLLPTALAICVACCLAVALGACGDDEDTTTATETEAAESSTAQTASTEEPDVVGEDPQPPTAAGTEGPEFFRSPSRNIGCALTKQNARCDIAERDWKPTPANEPCQVDYGNGISLNSNGAQFTCAGDTTLGAPIVLEYGQHAQRGNFFCDSAKDGITCSDLRTGAGFFISRESYRIF